MGKTWTIVSIVAIAAASLFSSARAGEVDQLVSDLSGSDDAKRVSALQRLPRYGTDAIAPLLSLLGNENPIVAKAGFDALWAIANEVSQPGREEARREAAGLLLPLLAPERSEEEKRKGLRLLAITVPPGANVSHIAALLDDPNLREPARATLERINTKESATALCAALPAAEPEFVCALLDALGAMRRPETIASATPWMEHGEARIRVAAARAVVWSGDPMLMPAIKQVRLRADRSTRVKADDALLRIAEAMATRGDAWQTAMNLYSDLLRSEHRHLLKAAAISGLCRYGDDSVVEAVLATARSGSTELRNIALQSLTELRGAGPILRLVELYPKQPKAIRLALIDLFGKHGTPNAFPLLEAAVKSRDAELRTVAMRALGKTGIPEGVPLLAECARDADEPERSLCVTSLEQLVNRLRQRGNQTFAGKAYLSLYELALDDTSRLAALDGIGACPVPEAYEAVLAASTNETLKPSAVSALVAVAGALITTGQHDKALEAYDKLVALNPPLPSLQGVAAQLKQAKPEMKSAERLGFVTSWWLAGPFELQDNKGWSTEYVHEPNVNLSARYRTGDAELTWRQHTTSDPMGIVNLGIALLDRERCIAYAYAEVNVERDVDAVVRLGVDDGEKLWVNDQLLLDHFVDRPLRVDEDQAPVHLKAGKNTLLLKIVQFGGGWQFCLRLTTPDGLVLPFTQ
ncbi:MAG: HEAT repeat domain-containing protein [Candidatus Hydrogenedentes bacterium]|nr:HEAT repeat domain-containing protein [Candidatus Hydrogenedentota bacterium]